ncbi:callose synthase 9-like [Silene latifolia]|uniref:callose synthase 9-like n=1 Tax=Silene latifolia TaxID=37657 RepID=UPI003D775880
MSRAEELWERLVRAALRSARGVTDGYGRHTTGIAGNVPASLANGRIIDDILRAADEIQDDDPNVARILCEHGYAMAQNLDPNSEGRGVLQFKTGLMSVIKQKLAKREAGSIDRSQDITLLREFYRKYRQMHNVEQLMEDETKLRESAIFSGNLGELERKTKKRKKIFATLKVLGDVLEQMTREVSPEEAERLLPDELKRVIESDAAMTEDLIAYNIIPLDTTSTTNRIVALTEVRAAVSALKDTRGLPKLPGDIVSPLRSPDVLDVLHYVFGFQKDNVNNQREHIVHLLANEQSRLRIPEEHEPKLDEAAVQRVFVKSLENYIKWCNYLVLQPVWSNLDSISKEKKLLFLSLYYLIWGEAANVRFLPECLCYIFHHMAREMDEILRQHVLKQADSCKTETGVSFLSRVIHPLYKIVAAEANNNDNGRAPHSAWRNYDDFNEYFWSLHCFELSWPWRLSSAFFTEPKSRSKNILKSSGGKRRGKTSFVEHRTFLHLYHSFHRLWIFLIMMFQALTIIAFNNGKFTPTCIKQILSLGPTFVVMKFIESVLDIFMMYGAYSTTRHMAVSRIFLRFIWFTLASAIITFLYVKSLQGAETFYKIYVLVIGIYAGFKFFISFLMRIPACHQLTDQCDHWAVIRFLKWMRQERYYVGRGMYESTFDFLKYMIFWLIVLAGKFSFGYFLQVRPLVEPTKTIVKMNNIVYSWHDFVSRNNYNALTILSIWAPVFCIYLLDVYVFYTIVSAVWGFLLGARDRLGEIRSLDTLHQLFEQFPRAFIKNLYASPFKSNPQYASGQVIETNKEDASRFSPFWNEIIRNLREEDYITNLEMELLLMPNNTGNLPLVQWPLFLLASKIFLARDIAAESRDSQEELWDRISRDEYMKYAVIECYHSIKIVLTAILEEDGRKWVERVYEDIEEMISKKSIHVEFELNKLSQVIQKVTALMGVLKGAETPDLEKGAVKAIQDLYDVIRHDVLAVNMRDHMETYNMLSKARAEGTLFSKLKWPKDPELKALIRRLYSLLTIKDSAANVPTNLEARRRLQFFTNSLMMDMPPAKPVREMMSFSVFTPYYSETVLYSVDELREKNEDGISVLFYLQKIYPDEWLNFLARIGREETVKESELFNSPDVDELRFWASYRGQTLARTVRGMMYYRKALMLQTYLERLASGDSEAAVSSNDALNVEGFELSPEARAQADLKFTYVVTCQIYGKQKEEGKPQAADIALLMQRNEGLRVAYIDMVETLKDGKVQTEYYSKLVKGDINGQDKEIYSIKLPGNPKLGEGKPENQNHAMIFTRGHAIQTIDMNQDNYFEEALKVRNLLEEFNSDNYGIRPPTILGVREHVFTGSVSSLASFMSNQEASFVTLGQRVLANPLKVRMHYGHPDIFDRVFHITRGGISKASRVINISEDIFAGFNSTLRQGNITHHEYIQVGKGRDVGLNQIAIFEGKVAGGNGEQVLSRDIYRLGQLFDFFRMMSFYFTTVGYYFCTMLTVLTVYIFLYGKTYLALSGVGETIQLRAHISQNTALSAALNTQFLIQIGVFTAIPMILGFILEQGFFKAIVTFITMQFQMASVFFTFSLGTRTHYFGRTILHGGARYQATGRGFVVRHIKFSENYRLYSRSHFVKGLEVVLLLIIFLAYGYNESGTIGYILLTISSWFMSLSWLFAPYLFNPSGFEWQKTVEDFRDWTNWLLYRGGIGVKGGESWEAWWEEELAHIRTLSGRIAETILSLRFFIFQYGIVYKLHVQGTNTSLAVYGFSWAALAVLILIFKVFTFSQKASVNFQLILRFVQGVTFLIALAGIAVAVALTSLSLPDIFACILAFIPTGWGILSIAIAWKPVIKRLGMWKSVRSLARLYDAGMGMIIFIPIAFFSWFPFMSTFQTRLMFNQAFSRGLEISLILAGNNANSGV